MRVKRFEMGASDLKIYNPFILIELLIDTGRSEEAGIHLGELSRLAQGRADGKTARWALARAC